MLEDIRTGIQRLTKRRVLGFIMSQFDPMGLMSPLLLAGKLLLRDLYGEGYQGGWDDALPDRQQASWYNFIKTALDMEEFKGMGGI